MEELLGPEGLFDFRVAPAALPRRGDRTALLRAGQEKTRAAAGGEERVQNERQAKRKEKKERAEEGKGAGVRESRQVSERARVGGVEK